MRIVLDTGRGERELVVRRDGADVTVADLLTSAGVDAGAVVHVDGRRVPVDHTLTEAAIPDGATVALHDRPPPGMTVASTAGRTVPRLAVVAGAGAGRHVALDRPLVVGRDPGCDVVVPSDTVSREHCRVVLDGRGAVTVTDLGTTNGTWVGAAAAGRGGATAQVGEVIRIGAVVLRIEPPVDEDRPRGLDPLRNLGPRGGVPFNRPPRPGAPPPVPPVTLPGEPPAERDKPPFNVAALVAPLVMGAVMVVALGSLRYAAFMLLSPVMLLANTVSTRRRHGKDSRTAARDHQADLARFESELLRAADAERARRWELLPSIAEVCRRVHAPSTRLWERRARHEDVLRLHAGVGSVPWTPAVTSGVGHGTTPTGPARTILDAHARLPRSPVAIDLAEGGVVGIVGDRTGAAALARSLLVQACVHHGPADVPVAVVVDEDRVGDWGWTTWLPHTTTSTGDRRLAAGTEQGETLLRAVREAGEAAEQERRDSGGRDQVVGPRLLVVLDATEHLRGRDADARAVLRGAAGPVAGIVLAATADQLPAVCDTVVEVHSADGEARLTRPAERMVVDTMLLAGLDVASCRAAARRLAGLEDPELVDGAAELPGRVDLVALLEEDATDPTAIARAWSRTAGSPSLTVPVGVTADGPLELDLVRDGPHGLLAGTTGSGKSELLRSLVAGLAATHDPDHLTFVLVDYKGGAAFDACADLPHVVGLVTDLDEHLGERALRCLEAELEHRERRLRAAGVSDLPQWLRLPVDQRREPLPRLFVVVDEFATLKAELPEFVSALVGVAQRGRSLGVHMLLGTQRPSGAVDENVRANSNLRIALRVTDSHDSSDVIGVGDAAHIPPSQPGRGVVRIGPGAVLPFQSALVTGHSGAATGPAVTVAPVTFGPRDAVVASSDGAEPQGATDLEQLVDACAKAFVDGGFVTPRAPWPEPLPTRLPLAELLEDAAAGADELPVARVDIPEEQTQRAAGWRLSKGNLLLHGVVGSGTTTTAAACVLAAATLHAPDDLHVQGLDLGRGELAALEALPHAGAIVTGREDERRRRLLQHWFGEAERRRGLDAAALDAEPRLVVVIDGLESLLAELDDPATYDVVDALIRFLADAPALRISALLTTTRAGGLRSSLTSTIEQRWTHRLADPADYGLLGLRPGDVPPLSPGRVVRIADGRELQVGHPGDLDAAVARVRERWGEPTVRPTEIRTLPELVLPDELVPGVVIGSRAWSLPVGRRERDLALAPLVLHRGEHAAIFGGPGSGRSGLLGALGAAVAADGGAEVLVVSGGSSSPLLDDGHRVVAPDALGAALTDAMEDERPTLVLVDDADRVPDPGTALDLLAGDGTRVHVVATARGQSVQADFGHWLRRVARSRAGAFVRPVGEANGDLLGARLPRRAPARVTPGRGWLVSGGEVDFVQFGSLPD